MAIARNMNAHLSMVHSAILGVQSKGGVVLPRSADLQSAVSQRFQPAKVSHSGTALFAEGCRLEICATLFAGARYRTYFPRAPINLT